MMPSDRHFVNQLQKVQVGEKTMTCLVEDFHYQKTQFALQALSPFLAIQIPEVSINQKGLNQFDDLHRQKFFFNYQTKDEDCSRKVVVETETEIIHTIPLSIPGLINMMKVPILLIIGILLFRKIVALFS